MGDIEQRQVRLKSDTRGPKNIRESEQREMVQLWGAHTILVVSR